MRYLYLLLLVAITASLSQTAGAQTSHLTLEPNHSTLGFIVDIAGGATKVTGKFTQADLKLTYVDKDWTKSSVDLSIMAESINTGIPDRDDHLRTADFFDVATYPTITFVSEQIKSLGDNRYEVAGTFTMHGITKEMVFPFEVKYEDGNTIGIHIETRVNRIDHQVGHEFVHTAIPNFLSDWITVEFDFWTKRDKRF